MADEFRDIRRALEKRLATIQDTNGDPQIAFENSNYDPKGETQWLRSVVSYTESKPASVGVNSQIRYDGLMFIDCFVKADIGTVAADALAQQVLDLFPYGELLQENGKEIRIRFSERERGFQSPPYYQVPVTVTWYSYI